MNLYLKFGFAFFVYLFGIEFSISAQKDNDFAIIPVPKTIINPICS